MSHKSQTNNYTEFYYHFFRNILIVALPLFIVSVLVLSSLHSSAAELSSADSVNISIPTSCTLINEVNDAHNASIINGRYVSDIGKSTITTYCNDENGYVVYAVGYGNNEIGNNKLVSSRSAGSDNYDIATGTATSGSTSNWAMKLTTTNVGNKVNDEYGYITNNDGDIVKTNQGTDTPVIASPYEEYTTIPSQWARVVTKPSRTVASTTGSSFSTTYAAYVSINQSAGDYSGQVRYLIAHPYNAPAVYYMQDVATWKDQLREEESILAVDRRDYKSYYVTKLKDGHIWMTQNLAIDLGETDTVGNITPRVFTSEDTDLTDHSKTGAYVDGYEYDETTGIATWTPADSAATIKFKGASVAGWSSSNTVPYSATKTDGPNTGHESLGNYYNWTATIASNDSSSLAASTYNNVANNPQNSICPKGWRLPTISSQSNALPNSTNEFGRLNYLYENVLISPLFFTGAGYINDTAQHTRANGNGVYSSSTAYNISSVYGAGVGNAKFSIDWWGSVYSGRRGGWSVRCVAR